MAGNFESFENCVMNVWDGPPSKESLQDLEALCREVAQQHDESLVLLVVVAGGAPILSADQRRQLEEFYQTLTPLFTAVGQVVEGTNLWSVTARSMMTALRLVQRRAYPLRVFSNADEGLQWIADFVAAPDSMTSEQVTAKLREIFATLRSRQAAAS